MEEVLDLYEQEYDPSYPVVCIDEKPCQILTDVIEPLPMEQGKIERYDYTYKRKGTCNVFIAFEPLSGKRFVQVRKQRTKNDYAYFMKALSKEYLEAKLIRVVQDNLNTHSAGSFYETFSAEEAFAHTKTCKLVEYRRNRVINPFSPRFTKAF